MAHKTKTVRVIDLLQYTNEQLARTDDGMTDEAREALSTMISRVLMRTNNYCGFQNLYWQKQGCEEWHKAGEPETYPEKDLFIFGDKDSMYRGSRHAVVYYEDGNITQKRHTDYVNILTK